MLEGALKRDHAIVIAALATAIILSWIYLMNGAGMSRSVLDMSSLNQAPGKPQQLQIVGSMSETIERAMGVMTTPVNWTLDYTVIMFFMWLIMMVAMMLPAATPMILLYALVNRKATVKAGAEYGTWPTACFTLGYLLAWTAFSVVAVILQWTLEMMGMLSPILMNSTNSAFAGILLLLAGMYQLTPIKQACLKHCRNPIDFLSRHWRAGAKGALKMGVHHGVYCLGCCWGLMLILFFGGVMNLYWIIGLALIILIEKLTPFGRQLSWITGSLLLVWGTGFLYQAVA